MSNPFIVSAFVAGLTILATSQSASALDEVYPPRDIPARLLPVPTTVSPELQKAIAQPTTLLPLPSSRDDLQRISASVNPMMVDMARRALRELRVTATPAVIAGVPVFHVVPPEIAPANKDHLIVHLHGGAFFLGGGEAATGEAAVLAYATKTPVITVDYRMPPDHPFPAALDDSVKVWRALLEKRDPQKMAIGGTSAGGGLTMSVVLKLKELGEPLPGALFIGTPASDLSLKSDSCFTNESIDNVIGACGNSFEFYAGGVDLKNPLLSPVYGDLRGFPPTILVTGTRDVLLSDTVRVHRKLRAAGVEADLQVFDALSHAQYLTIFPALEGREALGEIALFFDQHLKR